MRATDHDASIVSQDETPPKPLAARSSCAGSTLERHAARPKNERGLAL